jgi:hypothetical protein
VIYQDPLAYLLGLEGIALLDAWAGGHDREFVDTRLAEIRRLLDDEKLRDRGMLAHARRPAAFLAAGAIRPVRRPTDRPGDGRRSGGRLRLGPKPASPRS